MQTQFVIQVEKIGVQTIVDLQNFAGMQRKAQPVRQVQKTHLILELLGANGCVVFVANGIGINTATVQKYIREQEKQEQIEDSLSRKEYKDPFKGSK